MRPAIDVDLLAKLPVTTGSVPTCAFYSDGKLVVTGSHSGALHVWSALDGRPIDRLGPVAREVLLITFAADSQRVAAVDVDRTVWVWDLAARKPPTRIRAKAQAWHAAFLPGSNRLAMTAGKRVKVVDGATGRRARSQSTSKRTRRRPS